MLWIQKIYTMIISSILVFSLIAGLPSICAQNDTMSMDNYIYDECNIEFVQYNDTEWCQKVKTWEWPMMETWPQSQCEDMEMSEGQSEDQGEDNGGDEDKNTDN